MRTVGTANKRRPTVREWTPARRLATRNDVYPENCPRSIPPTIAPIRATVSGSGTASGGTHHPIYHTEIAAAPTAPTIATIAPEARQSSTPAGKGRIQAEPPEKGEGESGRTEDVLGSGPIHNRLDAPHRREDEYMAPATINSVPVRLSVDSNIPVRSVIDRHPGIVAELGCSFARRYVRRTRCTVSHDSARQSG